MCTHLVVRGTIPVLLIETPNPNLDSPFKPKITQKKDFNCSLLMFVSFQRLPWKKNQCVHSEPPIFVGWNTWMSQEVSKRLVSGL